MPRKCLHAVHLPVFQRVPVGNAIWLKCSRSHIFGYFRDGMSRAKFTLASALLVSASVGHGVIGFFVFLPNSETYAANKALLATKYANFSITSFVVADIVSHVIPRIGAPLFGIRNGKASELGIRNSQTLLAHN